MFTPLPPPDPHSLAPASALACLCMAAVLASLRNPWVETRGTRWFASAALVAAFSFLVITFAPGSETLLPTLLRTLGTVLVFGLLVCGLQRFAGQPVPVLLLLASLTLMALTVVLYPDAKDDVAPRVLVFTTLVSAWTLAGLWSLWRYPVPALPRRGPWATAAGLALLGVLANLRALLLVLASGPVTSFEALHAPYNAWLLLGGFLALMTSLTGIALMLNARLVQELLRWNSHDALTGCFNRRGFNAQWPAWLRAHGPGHVVLLDLESADGELPEPALMLLVHGVNSLLPRDALFARQGGGSFLVALPRQVDAVAVDTWCEQVETDLTQRLALLWSAGRPAATLALGHAEVLNGNLADAARRANLAMAGGHPHASRKIIAMTTSAAARSTNPAAAQ